MTSGIIGLVSEGKPRRPDDWGALAAWAWGLSRALDYFETDTAVDAKQMGVEGHSRYGKAALLAAALDQRWAIAYPSCSGEGGAKLSRRNWGETVDNIASSHWMAANFRKYAGHWGDLPVDSHELIALVAPRPVFLNGGTQDQWADPHGAFLAAVAAGPVYRLLGKKDLGTTDMPAPDTALVEGELAFRYHAGGHTDAIDFPAFLKFAQRVSQGYRQRGESEIGMIMRNTFTRRHFMKMTAAAAAAASWTPADALIAAQPARTIAPGPFKATWESLVANYKVPDWFRDAKFGIWAHWTAQCVPEQGDWYARKMYIQGERDYEYHVKTYGHPSKFGFMEIDNLWKAEKWDPARLIALYKRAGAKYFFGLANHHDNLDMYDSAHHAWNSVRVGPKKDIIGTWAKVVREHGLRFGVTNHASWAARWLQPAYGYDGEGPLAGVRYDAYTLTKADGKGKWWEGLDPQDLYTGNSVKMPDGLEDRRGGAGMVHRQYQPCQEQPHAAPCLLRELVSPLQGPGGQVPAGRALFRHQRVAAGPGRAGCRGALLQPERRAEQRPGGCRCQRQAHREGPRRRVRRGHRAEHGQRHPPRPLADRHLHRGLALQSGLGRAEPLRDRGHDCRHAHRHCEQEWQPDAEHPAAGRRVDRRA